MKLSFVSLFLLCGVLVGLPGCTRTALSPEAPAEEPSKPAAENKEAPQPAETFRFPKDAGGAVLAEKLAPSLSAERQSGRSGKRGIASVSDLKLPEMPLPQQAAELPRLPAPRKLHLLRPRLVSTEMLDENGLAVVLPERTLLPAGARVRAAARDPNEPLALPPLAQPVPNRASLEDATTEVSAAAVLTAPLPQRGTPAPFLRLTLPDPYEHRRPLRLPALAEATTPRTGTPQTPR
jgi:hypothetical protein